jgi:hypothetical protein
VTGRDLPTARLYAVRSPEHEFVFNPRRALTRGIIEELRAAGLEIRRIDGNSDTQSEALNCAGFCAVLESLACSSWGLTNGPHSDGFSPAMPAAPHLGVPAVSGVIVAIVRGIRATPLAEPLGPLWRGRPVAGEK